MQGSPSQSAWSRVDVRMVVHEAQEQLVLSQHRSHLDAAAGLLQQDLRGQNLGRTPWDFNIGYQTREDILYRSTGTEPLIIFPDSPMQHQHHHDDHDDHDLLCATRGLPFFCH